VEPVPTRRQQNKLGVENGHAIGSQAAVKLMHCEVGPCSAQWEASSGSSGEISLHYLLQFPPKT